jgi:alanyl-tRNA synthetase
MAVLLTAGLVAAQRGGGGGGGDRGGMMPRPQQQTKADQLAEKLKLNKEQKEQAAEVLKTAAESAGALNQKIANGRQMMVQAIVNGKDSGEDYDNLLAAFTAVLGEMDSVEATAYGKIYALLKPNQQKNAEPAFTELMAGMFARAGGGGGGRRRGQYRGSHGKETVIRRAIGRGAGFRARRRRGWDGRRRRPWRRWR